MPKIFPISRYEELVDETFEKVRELGVLKGGEYAGDTDRLANFRRNGEAWGMTMEQCWGVYAGKHWDAVAQYIRDSAVGKERVRLESLEGRVDDIITYCLLFKAMLEERQIEEAQRQSYRDADQAKYGARIMPHVDESDSSPI